MQSYKDLIVWQRSFEMVIEIYILTNKFPASEIYGLTSQMRRAAISIPSNIAEGYCRGSRKEFSQFINIAFASGAELETQIMLAESLKYRNEDDFKKSEQLLNEVMKMLNGLLKKLKN
jgi:four helix bundle protein